MTTPKTSRVYKNESTSLRNKIYQQYKEFFKDTKININEVLDIPDSQLPFILNLFDCLSNHKYSEETPRIQIILIKIKLNKPVFLYTITYSSPNKISDNARNENQSYIRGCLSFLSTLLTTKPHN